MVKVEYENIVTSRKPTIKILLDREDIKELEEKSVLSFTDKYDMKLKLVSSSDIGVNVENLSSKVECYIINIPIDKFFISSKMLLPEISDENKSGFNIEIILDR